MKIGVLGAGAIGCYLGGRLIAAGHDVILVGRLGAEVAEHGLTLTDYNGARTVLRPEQVAYRSDAASLADRDAVLVTVKSMATEEAARSLATILGDAALVVSFQNGVSNADVLRQALPGRTVLAGMVPFNVLRQERGCFHLGTSGPLGLESSAGAEATLVRALRDAGFGVDLHEELKSVLWSKLLFNLNNSINALAGVPLREELSSRAYRKVVASSLREALRCLAAAGIRPVNVGKMIPWLAPHILALPNVLFFRVAAAMVKIDPSARSSMWEDLERRRSTEIDYLNGEIIRLGERHGVPTPVNRKIRDLVRAAETAKQGSPRLSGESLLAQLR